MKRKLARTLLGAAVALPIAAAVPASAQKACGPCAPKAARKSCCAAKKKCGAKAPCAPKATKCGAAKKCAPCKPKK